MHTLRKSLLPAAAAVLTASLLLPLAAARGAQAHQHAGPSRAKGPTVSEKAGPGAANSCKACLEKGAVLDPNQFGKGYEPEVKPAYEAARKYPDTIDRIHCFCECKESQREHHKTLLTCFTNLHAAGCGICQHEAIMAAKMKDQGASDDEVEITVEQLHKTDGHPPTFGRGI